MLLLLHFLEGLGQTAEAVQKRMVTGLHEGNLAVGLQQRQGADHPPHGGDHKGNGHGSAHGQADLARKQHQRQTGNKGNDGTDVAHGITHSGNIVHPLLGGHLGQHGVVEHQTGVEAHLGDDEDHKEGKPRPCGAQRRAADSAQQHTECKDGFFIPPMIRQRTAEGADQRHKQSGQRGGVAPVGHILRLRQSGSIRQGVEVNGHNGGNQQDKGGITDVIQHPISFQGRKSEFIFHMRPSSHNKSFLFYKILHHISSPKFRKLFAKRAAPCYNCRKEREELPWKHESCIMKTVCAIALPLR